MSNKYRAGQFIDPVGGLVECYPDQNVIGFFNGVPTASVPGYAPGAFAFDITNADWYRNTGTLTSATWLKQSSGVDLSGLLATAAEINRTSQVASRMVTAIATLAVTRTAHENRTILLSLLAGFTSTLPAATGSGAIYRFTVGIVNTSGSYIITTDGTAVFNGSLMLTVPGSTYATAAKGETFAATTQKTITLNGTATGGATIGDSFWVQDIQTNVWSVAGSVTGTTTPTTMFS